MAQVRNIRICKYLHDWLIRAKDKGTCLQDSYTLLRSKPEEIRSGCQAGVHLRGYPYYLAQRLVRRTTERWQALGSKINSCKTKLLSQPVHVPDKSI